MIISNNQKGTVRENINHLKGDKSNDDYNPIGKLFKHDEINKPIEGAVDMTEIDPDDRANDDSEQDWKDFY